MPRRTPMPKRVSTGTAEDVVRVKALRKEMQDLMGKFVTNPEAGPYDPVNSASWEMAHSVGRFLEADAVKAVKRLG